MSEPDAVLVSADNVWLGRWLGPSVLRVESGSLEYVGPVPTRDASLAPEAFNRRAEIDAHLPGVVLHGITDHHVHLGLIDAQALLPGGIARVKDLGWEPLLAAEWAQASRAGYPSAHVGVDFAGAFLTSVGGYPSGSSWAPAASVRQILTPVEGIAAVAEMAALGVSQIKIALNEAAGPVWDDAVLEAVIAAAHAKGLPVVAHAEGAGQAQRAARAGADSLAHTPWTERLSDDEIALQVASGCAWISTLDIHSHADSVSDFGVATDNLARFTACGGRILYGTDLGNGPLPVGLNLRELEALVGAGLSAKALLDSLAEHPSRSELGTRISYIAGAVPTDRTEYPAWLTSSTVLAASDLKELFS